jgi:flagellar biosynthesis component FlhA
MNKTDAHLTFSVIAGRLRDSSAERIRQNNQLQPLTNVLRALLAEQFPIRELKSIIEVFRSNFARTQNLVEVCEAIRSHPSLKRENPFLSKKGCYFTLGRDFQCDIENGLVNGNHRVLAVEPEVCQELLAAVRTAVQSFGSNMPWPTGLVSRALLRPWIRRLVELEFPHLPVLAEEDVIPEFADRIRGSFDREGNIEWLK